MRQIIRRGLALTLVASVVTGLLGTWAMARGLALGGLASAANFWLMAGFLPKTLLDARGRAEAYSLASIVVRFVVMGAALAVPLVFPKRFSIAFTIAGLFLVQLTILAGRFLERQKA